MRNRILVFIAVVLLLVLLLKYGIEMQAHEDTGHTESTNPHIKRQQSMKKVSAPATLHTAPEKTEDRPSARISEKNSNKKDTSSAHLLYTTVSPQEALLHTPQKRDIEPVAAIALNTELFGKVRKGDILSLPDIEGLDYTLTVVGMQTFKNGATSLRAQYQDEGVTYTTTITHSDKETFITLSTSQGLYEIEAETDTGYIYRSSDISKELQKSHKDDVTILPVPKKPDVR